MLLPSSDITTNLQKENGRKHSENKPILMDVGTDNLYRYTVLDSKLKCQFLEQIGSQTRN